MNALTMAELDRLLHLKRGTANALRRKGVFEAEQVMGRLWAISEKDLPAVAQAISDFKSDPDWEAEGVTVSASEAADRLKIARSTVYNLIRLGRLRTVPVPRGRVFVLVESIEDYRQTRLPAGVGIRLPRRRAS